MRRLLLGSSAHAEIDPPSRRKRSLWGGLLRPSGERPARVPTRIVRWRAPPPTRRSTPISGNAGIRCGGSSAHAEIDPPLPCAPRQAGGLLRPRGDRPVSIAENSFASTAPPPT